MKMGWKGRLKTGGKVVLDRYARTGLFRWISPINYTLTKATQDAIREHARGDFLDAGAGRKPYQEAVESAGARYHSQDRAYPESRHDFVGDIATIDMGRGFDTILCTQVLEHVREPGRVLANLSRHLHPGGVLLLTVPHLSMLHNEPDDYFRYTHHALRMLLEQAGLEVLEIRRVGGFWVFFGHQVCTLYGNTVIGIPGLGPLLLRLVVPATAFFVLLDRIAGIPQLLPTNYLVVARKSG